MSQLDLASLQTANRPATVSARPGSAFRRSARLAGNAVFGVFLLAVVATIAGLTILPRIFDYQTYIVLTGSMAPTMPVGSVVIVVPVDPRQIKAGDVVSFTRWDQSGSAEPATITHRVNRVLNSDSRFPVFETKGDANPVPDALPVRYLGPAGLVVVSAPHIGQFFLFGRTGQGRTLMLTVPGVLFVLSMLWSIWRPRPKPAAAVASDSASPEPKNRFQVEIFAHAYSLLGDPAVDLPRKFQGLRRLAKRAERAGENDLVAWLESRLAGLADSDAAPIEPAPATVAVAARSEPAPEAIARRQALRYRLQTGGVAPAEVQRSRGGF